MESKLSRIFIGMVDTAGIGSSMASAFKKIGYSVTCYSDRRFGYPEHIPYDYVDLGNKNKLQKLITILIYFIKCLIRYDIFIFISGSTLLPFNVDLPVLKLLRKKVVMFFCGCDIRHFEPIEEEAERMGFKYYHCKECQSRATCSLDKKRKRVKWIEKYADLIFSYPDCAHLLSRRYQLLWNPVNVDNIVYHNRLNCQQPLIVHAPSDYHKKGTKYVIDAVERLKKDGYQFEFNLLQGISNKHVREILSRADISIDQLMSRGYGVFAVESMAAGCAVLGSVNKQYMNYPEELPIIYADPDNIYENLKMLLNNSELRHELGKNGREYQEKYHNPRKIANNIIRLLNTGESGRVNIPKQGIYTK